MFWILSFFFDIPWYFRRGNSLEKSIAGKWIHMKIIRNSITVAEFRVNLNDHELQYYFGGKKHGQELDVNSGEGCTLYKLWLKSDKESRAAREIIRVTDLWREDSGPWQPAIEEIINESSLED
jgi:hypothetical protein